MNSSKGTKRLFTWQFWQQEGWKCGFCEIRSCTSLRAHFSGVWDDPTTAQSWAVQPCCWFLYDIIYERIKNTRQLWVRRVRKCERNSPIGTKVNEEGGEKVLQALDQFNFPCSLWKTMPEQVSPLQPVGDPILAL